MSQHSTEIIKNIGDGVSLVTVIGALTQVLPAVAASFTILWTAMRIAEMFTGKDFSVLIGRKKDISAL